MAEHKSSMAGEHQPISKHPLFPVIVALWFGALFGLASVAIRPDAVRGLIEATGIGRLLPLTGVGLRIGLALAMTGLGAAIGVLVARRIAAPRQRSVRLTTQAVVSAVPEREDAAPAPMDAGRRRRSITPAAIEGGDLAAAAAIETYDTDPSIEVVTPEAAPDDAIDEKIPVEANGPDAAADEGLIADKPFTFPGLPRVGSTVDGFAVPAEAVSPAQEDASAHDDAMLPAFSPAVARAMDDADAPLANLNSRLFETYSRDLDSEAGAGRTVAADTRAFISEPSDTAGSDEASAADQVVPGTAAHRIANAELDELSPIELLERLALAMARRRSDAAATSRPSPQCRTISRRPNAPRSRRTTPAPSLPCPNHRSPRR